jgi:hypothetical protein
VNADQWTSVSCIRRLKPTGKKVQVVGSSPTGRRARPRLHFGSS